MTEVTTFFKDTTDPKPKTRRPIPAHSPQGAEYQKEYKLRSKLVHARSGGMCEVKAAHDCDGAATPTPHHRKFRSSQGSNSLDNLIDTCWSAHYWIHRILPREEAVRLQLVVPKSVAEYPYEPTA